MESPINGGLLYHEVQESKLCAVHCVNSVLQGPFFSELDLAALASDLDQRERQMMIDGAGLVSDQFLAEDSHNVSMGGDFSIQVLEKALEVWDLQVIPLDSPIAEPTKHDPALDTAYICHLADHWFCIRKVNGEWYNFNSLYAAPEHFTTFYLSAFLDTLKSGGWSIFLVRGNFPKECPISSAEASNRFGQWLTPEDAERMTKSYSQRQIAAQRSDSFMPSGEADGISDQEEADLKAAIEASLMDSAAFSSEASIPDNKRRCVDSIRVGGGNDISQHSSDSRDSAAGTETSTPKDSSNLSEPCHRIGQQFLPLKPCSQGKAAVHGNDSLVLSNPTKFTGAEGIISEQDESEDLNAAIEASLMDPVEFRSKSDTTQAKGCEMDSIEDKPDDAKTSALQHGRNPMGSAGVGSGNSVLKDDDKSMDSGTGISGDKKN